MPLKIVPNHQICYVKDTETKQICKALALYLIVGEDYNPTLSNGTVIGAYCARHVDGALEILQRDNHE